MLNIYTVAFFGHRNIDNAYRVEELLEEHVRKLIGQKEYVDFLVGRNGDFDRCASSAVQRVRKNYRDDNSSLVLVLPYATAEYLSNKESFERFYSEVEISADAVNAHPKSAIGTRNREMVDRADLIICYVEHTGGAFEAVRYAEKLGKRIINIAE